MSSDGRLATMRFENRFLITALLAVLLALPASSAIKQRSYQLQQTREQAKTLQLKLDEAKRQIQLKQTEVEKKAKQNKDLEKKLQSKRKAQATVAAAPQAQSAPVSTSCKSYAGLVGKYKWDTRIALAIMQAESGCNPNASSPTNDHGLMQINQGLGIYGKKIYDPAFNVKVAYETKYLRGGWGHWTVYNTGAYLRYM